MVEGERERQGEMIPERIVRRIGQRFIGWWTSRKLLDIAGVALLALAFLVGSLGYFNELGELLYLTETAQQIIAEFYASVSTELASIAITILFVDALYQHRETEREKRRLILQMGSPDNAFAREAVRALRSRGWLGDGSLQGAWLGGANLQGAFLGLANLQGADLRAANLQGANLMDANLREADLRYANLHGADLGDANLEGAKASQGTVWPGDFEVPEGVVMEDQKDKGSTDV